MKIKLLMLINLVFASFFFIACDKQSGEDKPIIKDSTENIKDTVPETVNNFEKHTMWKVESDSTTAWLLGSVHMLKEEYYPLDAVIEDAFESCDNLVLELNLNDVDLTQIAEFAMYRDGTTLKDHLPKKTYKKLLDILEESGMSISLFQNYKPGFAFMTLIAQELVRQGFNPQYGVDMHFLNKAGDKEVIGLETFEGQMDLINKEIAKYLEEYLEYSWEDTKNMVKYIDTIAIAWQSGNLEKIENLSFMELDSHPEYKPLFDKLIYERNEKMAGKIMEFLDTKQSYFIIVGAAHYVGEKGIIDLLTQTGKYRIEQL